MSSRRKGPGPSSVLLTPDHAGNVVGVDPHKRTLDGDRRRSPRRDPRQRTLPGVRGRASGAGGVGAAVRSDRPLGGRGRLELGPSHRGVPRSPAAMTCATCARTARHGLTARDSAGSPTRLTQSGSRARRSRTRCCPRRSSAPGTTAAPTSCHELLALWHNQRRSILTSRQHLLNEAEHLLCSCRWSCASSCPTPRRSAPARRPGCPQPPPAL